MARANPIDYERFAILMVAGKSQIDAFLACHPTSSRRNAGRNAHRFAKLPAVRKHVDRLLKQSARKSQMNRQELIEYLANALHTPAGDIDLHHPLCQAIRTTKDGTELKMPDKLGAAALLSKLQGWNEPEKHELSPPRPNSLSS